MPDRFTVIRVSEQAKALIDDLEAAYARVLAADIGVETANAYAALCQRRKEVYEYLQGLEFNSAIRRDVTLRFD